MIWKVFTSDCGGHYSLTGLTSRSSERKSITPSPAAKPNATKPASLCGVSLINIGDI